MQYETVRALRQAKLKNKAKPYNISDDGRCFIIVVANDKKLYQVKFNLTNTKGNQNELVTHFIGSNMNAPTLNGRLVEFSDRVLKSILDGLSKKTPNIDKSAYKQNKLFGIEWHEEIVSIRKNAHRNKISDYTPTKIITSMEEFAKEHKVQNMEFRRKHISSVGKKMDAVVYEDAEKEKLLVGIDVTTRAVNEFTQKALYSAISLSKAIEAKKIKEAVLRMPSIGDKASEVEYREAYTTINNDFKKVTIIDTADNKEFFGVLDNITKKYGNGLF